MTLVGGALALLVAVLVAQGPHAAAKRRRPPAPAPTAEKHVTLPARTETATAKRAEPAAAASSDTSAGSSAGSGAAPEGTHEVRAAKTRTYTFGVMDVEGKLKTPQLLYFLNRVKLELEMSAPDHRSFMKELERTADDPNL